MIQEYAASRQVLELQFSAALAPDDLIGSFSTFDMAPDVASDFQ